MTTSDDTSPIIGIDLGTSNCCIALWSIQNSKAQRIEIVRNAHGDRTTPSVISLREDGSVIVGAPARRQAVMNPRDTISEVKRLVGLPFYSPEVSSARSILAYEIFRTENGDAWVKAAGRELSPQEVQAYILEELVESASAFLGKKVTQAVITVPAFYDETQRQAVRDAAKIAGLTVNRILSEPTAAALAYGYSDLDSRKIAVVDLGGGTLDVTIMSIERGKFEVLATDGDNTLGGADFDRVVANHFATNIEDVHGIDVRNDRVAMQRLLMEAETAKRALSSREIAEVQLPYLAQKGADTVNFTYQLSKEEYESIVTPLVKRITAPCANALAQADVRATQLDDVILIGGMTRSPIVNQNIEKLFHRKPLFRVNPDEAVAMGAALLGASLSGLVDEINFIDVVPRTIGLSAAGDTYVPLIKKSSRLPAACRKAFATTRDQQQSFELDILQGESTIASENRRLSQISISPITEGKAGEVVLELIIYMLEDGSLSVKAHEQGSENAKKVTIETSSGLDKMTLQELCSSHQELRAGKESALGSTSPDKKAGGGFSIVMTGGSRRPKSPAASIQKTSAPPASKGPAAPLRSPTRSASASSPAIKATVQSEAVTRQLSQLQPSVKQSQEPPRTSLATGSSIPWLWIALGVAAIAGGALAFFLLNK